MFFFATSTAGRSPFAENHSLVQAIASLADHPYDGQVF